MSANKQTVEQYLQGFMALNHTQILDCLTEDISWEMPGFFSLQGKEAFNKEIENDLFEGSPCIYINRMVEENNVVIAEGTVKCKLRSGDMLDAMFCDVFQMNNGKIQQLTTYQMNR